MDECKNHKWIVYPGKVGCGFLMGVIYLLMLSWVNPLIFDEFIFWSHDLFNILKSSSLEIVSSKE